METALCTASNLKGTAIATYLTCIASKRVRRWCTAERWIFFEGVQEYEKSSEHVAILLQI